MNEPPEVIRIVLLVTSRQADLNRQSTPFYTMVGVHLRQKNTYRTCPILTCKQMSMYDTPG